MRNLKKFMAVLLVVAMIAAAMVPAFAETATLSADATICKNLGMLEGADASGVTPEYTATSPSRIQAAVLFLRLKGLEDEAKAFTGTDNFADVQADAWYAPITAYLKANAALGFEGVADNTFDADSKMTAQAYYKVVLTALGYKQGTDFTWDEVFTFAASKGLKEVATVANFTVNDLAIATVEGLKATVKGSNDTLATALVTAGAIDADAAEAAGLYTPAPTELAVVSVKALNLVQVEVKFNMEVDKDSAETEGNYDVEDKNVDFAELQDDNKTVILNLDSAADQQDKLDVTIEDVEDLDENALDEVEFADVKFLDTVVPEVESAEIVGIDTIKVTFSEPVTPDTGETLKAGFAVVGADGNKIYVKADSATGTRYVNDNKTAVYVVLSSDLDTEESVTIEVDTDLEDYAGFGVASNSTELDVVVDTEAPKVVDYKDAKSNEVTLIFDGDIKILSGATVDDFYHTNSKNPVSAVPTVENGNELTLTFAEDYELPEGTAYVYINEEIISDLWDNENEQIMTKVEVEVDETEPTIEKIEVDAQNAIIITFSEEVTDVERADFTVLDSDDEKASISTATVQGDDSDEVKIVFKDDLSGDYSISVEGIEDVAGNEISAVTEEFTVEDETSPVLSDSEVTVTLYDAGTEDQMIKVYFNEKMDVSGQYSVADLANYTIVSTVYGVLDLSDMDDISIDVVDDGEGVEISIPFDATDNDNDNPSLVAGVDTLIIARVADAAGNYTTALSTEKDLDDGSALEVAIDSVEIVSADTIEVTLTDKISDFYEEDFILTSTTPALTNADIAGISLEEDDDGNTVVVITLDDEIVSGGYAGFQVATAGTTQSETVYGVALKANDSKAVTDKVAPVLAEDADDNAKAYVYDAVADAAYKIDTIILEYEEALDAAYINKYTYEVENIDVVSIQVASAVNIVTGAVTTLGDGKYVVITLDTSDEDIEDYDTEFAPNVEQVASIFDASTENNELKAADADVIEVSEAPVAP